MIVHARFLSLVMAGLPWQAPTSCQSIPENWQVNPIYGVLVAQAGGSPPAVSQKFAYFYHTQFPNMNCIGVGRAEARPYKPLSKFWGGDKPQKFAPR
jgi:hypothetical protein